MKERIIMRTIVRITGGLVFAFALVTAFYAWCQNYTIGIEESINIGDSIDTVEGKKGLLVSKEISVNEVNDAYQTEPWLSIVNDDGGEIRSYYFFSKSFPLPSGFVVVFDNNEVVFTVIPTDS